MFSPILKQIEETLKSNFPDDAKLDLITNTLSNREEPLEHKREEAETEGGLRPPDPSKVDQLISFDPVASISNALSDSSRIEERVMVIRSILQSYKEEYYRTQVRILQEDEEKRCVVQKEEVQEIDQEKVQAFQRKKNTILRQQKLSSTPDPYLDLILQILDYQIDPSKTKPRLSHQNEFLDPLEERLTKYRLGDLIDIFDYL